MRAKELRQGIIVSVLLLIAFGLISLIWGLAGKARIAIEEAHKAQRQYQILEERKVLLEGNLVALETSRGKDAAIRTAFGVARPGEEVIVVVPPTPATTTPELSWWQRILSWFR